jgi:hypothetical protein
MDTLFKALRTRGHEVILKNGSTYAVIKGQDIKIFFCEKLKRIIVTDARWNNSEYHPTDILAFKLDGYYGKEWKDGKDPLENHLPEILAKLEIESDRITEQQKYFEKQREEWREKERIQQALQEKKEKDLTDFKEMLEKADRWHKAVNLRNYISEVERQTANRNGNMEDLKDWLAWARKKVDWFDPFTELADDLINDVERTSLSVIK